MSDSYPRILTGVFTVIIATLTLGTSRPHAFIRPFLLSWRSFGREESITNGYLNLRAGMPKETLIWHYSGIMRNPLTGSEIVGVEGLEFARRLTSSEAKDIRRGVDKIAHFDGQEEDVGGDLRPRDREKDEISASYISTRVFIYTDLNNRTQTITSFRSGRHAPRRPVNPIKVLHQVVSIFAQESHASLSTPVPQPSSTIEVTHHKDLNHALTNTNATSSRKKPGRNKIIAEVLYPGGRILRTDKVVITREHGGAPPSLIDSAVEAPTTSSKSSHENVNRGGLKRRSQESGISSQQYRVINFMRGKPKKPVNRWISFSPVENSGSGRSQEYYTISALPKSFRKSIPWFGYSTQRTNGELVSSPVVSSPDTANKWRLDWSQSLLGKLLLGKFGQPSNRDERDSRSPPKPESPIFTEEKEMAVELELEGSASGRDVVMRYTRYGECPPWYSIGRFCTTELTAFRYHQLGDVPLYVRKLISVSCPGFLDKGKMLGSSIPAARLALGTGSGGSFLEEEEEEKETKKPFWAMKQEYSRRYLDTEVEDFHQQIDILDNYKPWYSNIPNPFRRRRKAKMTELIAEK